MLVTVVVTIVFQLIHIIHIRLGNIAGGRQGYWEIPLQTLESLFEYRMINFFAPSIGSAKLLRALFIVFGTFFAMAYNSKLRASLLAKETDKAVTTLEVKIFHITSRPLITNACLVLGHHRHER